VTRSPFWDRSREQSRDVFSSDVSLHSFPSDKKRRKEWEDACGRIQLPKDPRLCSRHFSPDAFEAFSRPQLKPNALPSIFPHKESKRTRISSEIRAETNKLLNSYVALTFKIT
uniref:THAP-type domain-containing protein n=1 Tax=Sinocyclocheilus rhinocerous TaxID=307959 RepID=A0A673K9X7_9TELE